MSPACMFGQIETEVTRLELARLATIDGWWVWALLLIAIAAALTLCVVSLRRDISGLPRPIRWSLLWLRIAAIGAVVFLFFDLVRRTERQVTRPSEVAVLVDVSQSMTLPAGTAAGSPTRIAEARRLIDDGGLLRQLSAEHRTKVYAFGGGPPEPADSGAAANERTPIEPEVAVADVSRPVALFGLTAIGIGLAAALFSIILGIAGRGRRASRSDETADAGPVVGWSIWIAALTLLIGIAALGGAYAARPEMTLAEVLGLDEATVRPSDNKNIEDDEDEPPVTEPLDWRATALQSRIAEAIGAAMVDLDVETLAGVVVLTDGQTNGGEPLRSVVPVARRGEVPVYPVGLGSRDLPAGVSVLDLEVPRRVYPGDAFPIDATIAATGTSPVEVVVDLVEVPIGDDSTDQTGEILKTQTVTVDPAAGLRQVHFEIRPEVVGKHRVTVRLAAPPTDPNAADDTASAEYEVVARKMRVLIVAGGPTREYRFARNLLFRDDSVRVDVLLQSRELLPGGGEGVSQDADEILVRFPATADALFEYDAVLMFDPDWSAIDSSSLELLDRFVAVQAGGLVIVAGPVYHGRATSGGGERQQRIESLYPVRLASAGGALGSLTASLGGGRRGGTQSWPLELTADAAGADFLQLGETRSEDAAVWQAYEGWYDYAPSTGAKPAARVYARFSDPTTRVSGELPVALASQYYGAGRTYFAASGEMWRLRSLGEGFFEAYYTQLLRWVAEGRLLRDSSRGVLLVDPDKAIAGQTITVRAVLVDDQYQPLVVPDVVVTVLAPGGRVETLSLTPTAGAPPGSYSATLIAAAAGTYDLELDPSVAGGGSTTDGRTLRKSVTVRLPTGELERPQRADESLIALARGTGGQFVPLAAGFDAAAVAAGLAREIAPRRQLAIFGSAPDAEFTRRRNATLLWLIATALTFHWVVRRLHRLA